MNENTEPIRVRKPPFSTALFPSELGGTLSTQTHIQQQQKQIIHLYFHTNTQKNTLSNHILNVGAQFYVIVLFVLSIQAATITHCSTNKLHIMYISLVCTYTYSDSADTHIL